MDTLFYMTFRQISLNAGKYGSRDIVEKTRDIRIETSAVIGRFAILKN